MAKLNVGVLGLGNFGGQVANIAAINGFPAMAFNASNQDLDMLSDKVTRMLIGDGKGTGKNGEYAREFLLNRITILEEKEVSTFISINDVIVVAGSAGGGFGSNTLPMMMDILSDTYPDTLFIALTTLPELSETYTAQNYSERFLRSLIPVNDDGVATPYVPYIIYDNDNYKDLSPVDMNAKILDAALSDLRVLRGDYITETTTGGIDDRDLMTAISTPGRLVINLYNGISESELIEDSIVKTIRASIDKSAHVRMVDDKLISASAIMYSVGNDLAKYTSSVKEDMQTVFGEHITDYRNETVNDGEEEFVATILAGLTEPTTRIDKIIARRQAIENTINSRKAASTKLNTVAEGSLGLTPKKFGPDSTAGKLDRKSIMEKYGKAAGTVTQTPKSTENK